ncbi:FecR family protein [Aquimarina aggregata]|uniref:FecR family protein n=1 Tax=Aquimarina aggregata TaxID=1642818 RepID=UPI00248FCD94|nr:FecR domain-containing protein [Aquimarina aggregata]
MKKDMNEDDFLGRWLADDLSSEEKDMFEDSDDYLAYKDIVKAVDRFDRPVFDIDKGLKNQKEFNKTYKEPSAPKVIKLRTWLYSAAAVVVVLFGLRVMFFDASEISTDMAQTRIINLPDNSIVTLNADSAITYDKDTFEEDRVLTLKGEAFFDVAKGSKFTVQTKNGNIAVLGTEFDVYARDKKLEVHCFEGKVQVTKDKSVVVLTAGKGTKSSGQESLLLFDVTRLKPDWLNGTSSFDQVPISEVIQELQRQYNVKINTQDIDLNRLFTGFFGHDDLKKALKTSFEPMNIRYTFKNKKTIELQNK